jgi:hypothetical protein
VFRGCRIAVNAVAAIATVLLLDDPTRDLTPICLQLAVAVALWFGPAVWRWVRK